MTSDTSYGRSSSVGMSPASAKAAVDTWRSSSTRKKTSSKTSWEKADTWGLGDGLGILVTLLGKFNKIKGSPMVTRRKSYTKRLCSSVSCKNDKPIYP